MRILANSYKNPREKQQQNHTELKTRRFFFFGPIRELKLQVTNISDLEIHVNAESHSQDLA